MYEDEPMPYVLSFDPIAERAKAMAELLRLENMHLLNDNLNIRDEAVKILLETMKPPPMPQEDNNVTPFPPTSVN